MRKGLIAAGLLAIALSGFLRAAEQPIRSDKATFRIAVVSDGLEHPWAVAFLPDSRYLVTERPGRLRLITADGRLDPQPVAGVPAVAAVGQGGLLDVALHPKFSDNRWVYLSYAGAGEGGVGTEVARGRLVIDAAGARLEGLQVIYRQQPKSNGRVHFGSRLVFDRAGYLYVTQGDRGDMERAQRLDDLAGKLVRLHDDGRVPADNPWAGQAGARPEIFSVGHRSMQGAALHPATGELWTHEHGPQGGDEINIARTGRNYGWPIITYGVNYGIGTKIGVGTHKDGLEQPLHQWTPSIAPSGMAFYIGDRFPGWRGNLFVGALKFQMLVRLELDGNRVVREERLLTGREGRIRDVRQGPDGLLYLLTDAPDGRLLRLEPATGGL
nr:PQQ-dependent sugar dehydrogenase [Dechloromonas sp.]